MFSFLVQSDTIISSTGFVECSVENCCPGTEPEANNKTRLTVSAFSVATLDELAFRSVTSVETRLVHSTLNQKITPQALGTSGEGSHVPELALQSRTMREGGGSAGGRREKERGRERGTNVLQNISDQIWIRRERERTEEGGKERSERNVFPVSD